MESRSVSKFRNAKQVEPGPDQFVMKHMPLVKAIAAGIRRNLPVACRPGRPRPGWCPGSP